MGLPAPNAFSFEHLAPPINPDDVWRCLGPAGGAKEKLVDAVAWATAQASELACPQAVAVSLPVVGSGRGRVQFGGGPQIAGRLVSHLFDGAIGGVFTIATAGPGIERRVASLFAEGEALQAFVLDAAGSAMAMAVFADVAAGIGKELEVHSNRVGPCLKPGTDAWALEGQRAIFDVVPAASIGVRLMDSLLMNPQKTQSGVIPFGPNLRIINDPGASPCRTCSAPRCPMRVEAFQGPTLPGA
ncbi:MAG: hypothetical protein HY678_06340 [Chloroflexi bacterium]|nr:hypothetical protein [Chloroflexota bacterium]